MSKSKKKSEVIIESVTSTVTESMDSAIAETLKGGSATIHHNWAAEFIWGYKKNPEDGHLYPYYELTDPKGAQIITLMAALKQKSFDEFMQEAVTEAISQRMAISEEIDPTEPQDIEFTSVTEM